MIRPSKYSKDKDTQIQVRASSSDKKLIQKAARSTNLSLSDFILKTTRKEAERIVK